MLENNSQVQPQQELTADQAAASLALATKLSEGLMPQIPSEPSQTLETAPGEEITAEQDKNPMNMMVQEHEEKMAEMEKKMEDMREEMRAMIKEEVSSIKESIQEALKDDSE